VVEQAAEKLKSEIQNLEAYWSVISSLGLVDVFQEELLSEMAPLSFGYVR
jgi:hypothetical protein